jgi:hypothetical protein
VRPVSHRTLLFPLAGCALLLSHHDRRCESRQSISVRGAPESDHETREPTAATRAYTPPPAARRRATLTCDSVVPRLRSTAETTIIAQTSRFGHLQRSLAQPPSRQHHIVNAAVLTACSASLLPSLATSTAAPHEC